MANTRSAVEGGANCAAAAAGVDVVAFDKPRIRTMLEDVANDDRAEGFVFGLQHRRSVAIKLLAAYNAWSEESKFAFLLLLAELMSDTAGVHAALHQFLRGEMSFMDLRLALVPDAERFIKFIASVPKGAAWLIFLRADVRKALSKAKLTAAQRKFLTELDVCMRELFSTQQSMKLRRITNDAPEQLKAFIVKHEGVHPVSGPEDLARRLGGESRYYFGLFHPSMPTAPLAFVQMAVGNRVADSVEDILSGRFVYTPGAGNPVAVYYSVTNSMAGLQGLQLASYLLFLAMEQLSPLYPKAMFVTLSPVPGFRTWLMAKLQAPDVNMLTRRECENVRYLCSALGITANRLDSEHLLLRECLVGDAWLDNGPAIQLLKPILLRLCGLYLMFERQHGKTLDIVGNFHIQNGATIERINFMAHKSPYAVKSSFTVMVNYRYDTRNIKAVSSAYKQHSIVAGSRAALLLNAMGSTMFAGMPEEMLAGVDVTLFARVFRNGEIIATADQLDTRGVYFVSNGKVQVTNAGGGIESYPAGTVFGAVQVLLGLPPFRQAVAVGDSYVLFVPAGPLQEALERTPGALAVMKHYATQTLVPAVEASEQPARL